MSQAKVDKYKSQKKNRKREQRKKEIAKMLWIIAGCVVFGSGLGFLLGKYVIYPNYMESSDSYSQNQSDSEFLEDLNWQILLQDMQDQSGENAAETAE